MSKAAMAMSANPGPPSPHHHHQHQHHHGNDDDDDDNETTTAVGLPQWLQEQCTRLRRGQVDLRNLNLNIRRLDAPMVEALSYALRCNGRIEVVNLTSSLNGTSVAAVATGAIVGDRQNDERRRCRLLVAPLAFAIQCHPSLQTLYLSYNRLVDVIPLAISLEMNQSALRELHLDHNQLGPETAIALAQTLQINDTLRVLHLNSNRIGEDGGIAIAQALGWPPQRGGGLKTLGLARNGLGHETVTALWKALHTHRNVALTRLDLEGNFLDLYGGDGITAASASAATAVVTDRVLWLVRANRAGRYLLQHHSGDITTNGPLAEQGQQQHHHPPLTLSSSISLSSLSSSSSSTPTPITRAITTPPSHGCNRNGLWPHILEGLEVDILYYFLREKPDLVPGRYATG